MIWLQMREKWTIFSMRSEWFLFDFFTQFHVIPMLVSTFIIALISHFLYLSTTFWSVSFVYFSKWLMNLPETKISLFLTPFLPHSIVSVFIWNTSVLRHLLRFFPFYLYRIEWCRKVVVAEYFSIQNSKHPVQFTMLRVHTDSSFIDHFYSYKINKHLKQSRCIFVYLRV